MRFADRKTVNRLRRTCPADRRDVLDEMDDSYAKILIGAQATVTGVDDAGNVMCLGDMGSSLPIAFEAGRRKVVTEDGARSRGECRDTCC